MSILLTFLATVLIAAVVAFGSRRPYYAVPYALLALTGDAYVQIYLYVGLDSQAILAEIMDTFLWVLPACAAAAIWLAGQRRGAEAVGLSLAAICFADGILEL